MWLAFAAAVVVVMAAMGWTTAAVLRLDRAEAESRRRAQLEENVRLALWRMDSALAPLIAAEHARPATSYSGGFSGAPPVSPPLPGTERPFVRVYFHYGPDGTPRPLAGAATPEIERLATVAPFTLLNGALPPGPVAPEPEQVAQGPTKGSPRGYQEYQARAANSMQQLQVQAAVNRAGGDPGGAISVMHPVWSGEELVLARRTLAGRQGVIQACWVDWPAVRAWLLESVKDLLPRAQLLPLDGPQPQTDDRLLASLPVRLVPGELPPQDSDVAASPLRTSLLIAWACVLLATMSVALLLRGVVSLSERRGAFVSAVTHELRTPLTTLRMYTEMLEGGMVDDEQRRRHYLGTLRAEADRLGHLVENVLAYSRLERNRAGYQVTTVRLGEVLARTTERLAERARQAGMELVADVRAEVAATSVRTNALALEQILFNLVDNACKYAAGAADKRIHLRAINHEGDVLLLVRDHGPGVPRDRAARLFRAFSKSAEEAANSAPGLGLGLALSQRLARSMGAGLHLDPAVTDGAAFVISLPQVREA
jgi:signal transduction histidine kinase